MKGSPRVTLSIPKIERKLPLCWNMAGLRACSKHKKGLSLYIETASFRLQQRIVLFMVWYERNLICRIGYNLRGLLIACPFFHIVLP